MGTRADFYVGRGAQAEWLGSIGWDGYPDGIPGVVISASTEPEFRLAVYEMLHGREDGTLPEDGWPWPWENSRTTDYAYAFDGGVVYYSCFGREWLKPGEPEPEGWGSKKVEFPDMMLFSNGRVPLGPRSGLIVLGG